MDHMKNTTDYFDIAMECHGNFAWYLKGCLAYWAEQQVDPPYGSVDPQKIAWDWLVVHHSERLLVDPTEILEKD